MSNIAPTLGTYSANVKSVELYVPGYLHNHCYPVEMFESPIIPMIKLNRGYQYINENKFIKNATEV